MNLLITSRVPVHIYSIFMPALTLYGEYVWSLTEWLSCRNWSNRPRWLTLAGFILSYNPVFILLSVVHCGVSEVVIEDKAFADWYESAAVALTALNNVSPDGSSTVTARWCPFKANSVGESFNAFQILRWVWYI